MTTMTEHERNLYDLYAGLAMVGWVMNGDYTSEVAIANRAHDLAEQMLRIRKERHEDSETDMAVSDFEGRQDSNAEAGLKAIKKAKAGLK